MKTQVVVAVLSAGVALASAAIAFYSQRTVVNIEKKSQKELAELRDTLERAREASGLFREKQLSLYLEASQVASQIATLEEGEARARATQRFWELFWGNLAVFEDKDVEAAMVGFSGALSGAKRSNELKQASLRLAHVCRDSLERAWGVDLGELENLRETRRAHD